MTWSERRYIYLGTRGSDPGWNGRPCRVRLTQRGGWLRGSMGNVEVRFADTGERCVVVGRRLRKIKAEGNDEQA